MLEIGERRHAGAEIIEREATTQPLQLVDETDGAAKVGYGAGFGDFETDHPRRNGVFDEQALQVFEELVIANARPRQVDRTDRQRPLAPFVQALADDQEHIAHHPAVQRGHQAVALGRRDEAAGQDGTAAFVVQA
ncbi:hypothetical protein D3C78_678500 [compost metagenome]